MLFSRYIHVHFPANPLDFGHLAGGRGCRPGGLQPRAHPTAGHGYWSSAAHADLNRDGRSRPRTVSNARAAALRSRRTAGKDTAHHTRTGSLPNPQISAFPHAHLDVVQTYPCAGHPCPARAGI